MRGITIRNDERLQTVMNGIDFWLYMLDGFNRHENPDMTDDNSITQANALWKKIAEKLRSSQGQHIEIGPATAAHLNAMSDVSARWCLSVCPQSDMPNHTGFLQAVTEMTREPFPDTIGTDTPDRLDACHRMSRELAQELGELD